jgi:TPP-dependent pyruvate/acetoin dehydrogenase alpha subunit
MHGAAVDGMDVLAVETAVRHAAETIRGGCGPVLLEARTYRYRAHSMYDPELYRDKAEVERWKKRCPIEAFAAKLREAGLLADDDWKKLETGIAAEIVEAVAAAEAGPWEPVEDLLKDVHTPATGSATSGKTAPRARGNPTLSKAHHSQVVQP